MNQTNAETIHQLKQILNTKPTELALESLVIFITKRDADVTLLAYKRGYDLGFEHGKVAENAQK